MWTEGSGRTPGTTIKRHSMLIALLMTVAFQATTAEEETVTLTPSGTSITVGPEPYFIFVEDFNQDGIPDLAVANRGPLEPPGNARPGHDTISVLIAHGNGEFHAAQDYQVGFAPYTVEGGDFDEDGVTDLAIVCFQSSDNRDVAILSGRKDGSFSEAQYLNVDGDFDYDKHRLPDGAPVYASPGLTSLDITDVDLDGHLDLVCVAWSSDLIVTFHGDGQGGFGRQQVMTDVPSGPRDVAAHDFDQDGIPDLVLTHYSSDVITLWQGDGRGRFVLQQKIPCGGHTPYHLELSDLNQDGRTDLVVGNRGASDNVVVFRGDGGFRFSRIAGESAGVPNNSEAVEHEIRDVLITDLNGDGQSEIIAACRRADTVVLWDILQGASHIELKRSGLLHLPESGPRALATGDFDQDGRPELAVALGTAGTVVILRTTNGISR